MKFAVGLAIAILGGTASACVSAPPPAVRGGSDVALKPDILPHLRVRKINSTTARLYNVDLGPGFGPALAAQLATCLGGEREVDLHLHIEQPDRERLTTTYEFTDPLRDDAVIGRYRRSVSHVAPLMDFQLSGERGAAPQMPPQPDIGVLMGRDLCGVLAPA